MGRVGYDNWFVVMAQRWNVTLIDGTKTIHNLHQEEDEDGMKSSRVLYGTRETYLNYEAAGRQFRYGGGVTDCSFWRSVNCSESRGKNRSGRFTYSVCLERNNRPGGCRNPD